MNLKEFWQIGYFFFKDASVFKFSFIFDKISNFTNLLVIFLFWYALKEHGLSLNNYNGQKIMSYFIFSFIIGQIILSTNLWKIGNYIISGNISSLLLYPLESWKIFLSWDIVSKLINSFLISLYLLPFLVVIHLNPLKNINKSGLIYFIVLLIIGALIFSLLVMIINSLAFHLTEMWSIQFLLFIILNFFSGQFIPLDVISTYITYTPFAYINFWPTISLLQPLNWSHFLLISGLGLAWIGIFLKIYQYLWQKGLKTFTGWGE